MSNNLENMSNNLEKQKSKETVIAEQPLGPEVKYENIVREFKELCRKHPDIIFAEYEENGINMTNDRLAKSQEEEEDRTIDPRDYKDAFAEWHNFLVKNKIEGFKTNGLAKFLHRIGEEDLAKRIDSGPSVEGSKE